MVSGEVHHILLKHLKKSVLCVCMNNWLLLPIQDNTNFYITDWSYFANAMRISPFCKILELIIKVN